MPGPLASATLARVEALSVPTRWLRGDGERAVAAAVGTTATDGDLGALMAALTMAELGEARAEALGDLPLTIQLDSVLFRHASPRRHMTIASPELRHTPYRAPARGCSRRAGPTNGPSARR